MTESEYEDLKHRFHVLGQRAKGKAHSSTEWKEYQRAKKLYHQAGEQLRREREQRTKG